MENESEKYFNIQLMKPEYFLGIVHELQKHNKILEENLNKLSDKLEEIDSRLKKIESKKKSYFC